MSDASGLVLALRTVVSLAVVLALLVFFLRWLERQSSRTRSNRGEATVRLSVLTRLSLGRGSSVQVVRVGTQVLVLGVTEQSVSVLTDLGPADFEHEDAVARTRESDSERGGSRGAAVGKQGAAVDSLLAALARRQGRHRDETVPPSHTAVEDDSALATTTSASAPADPRGG